VSDCRSIESLLADAHARLVRLRPQQAHAAAQDGALLVDTRSRDEQVEQHGVIPGAVHYPLSVVLWRLDGLPRDTRVILICRHGESSSLAADRLHELGFRDATDVEGGFEAWAAAGLPVDAVGPDR
jgi:rhodanese-related sulfurtransferase